VGKAAFGSETKDRSAYHATGRMVSVSEKHSFRKCAFICWFLNATIHTPTVQRMIREQIVISKEIRHSGYGWSHLVGSL
jgi:hypothetical protein